MLRDSKTQTLFDTDAYDRAHSEIVELTGRLPQVAIRTLAEEVMARLSRRIDSVAEDLPIPSSDEIDRLCQTLISQDANLASKTLATLTDQSTSLETIYTVYLAAAARRLGIMWEEDAVGFAEVTVGIGRIYAIMRSIRARNATPRTPSTKFAVFAAVPEEDHTLGVTMAADIFREHGWRIDLRTGRTHEELIEDLEKIEFDLIGLSASTTGHLTSLVRLIVAIRLSKPRAIIMVSGTIVTLEPDIMRISGADFATPDINEALAEMQRNWDKDHFDAPSPKS